MPSPMDSPSPISTDTIDDGGSGVKKFTLRLGPDAIQDLEWIARQYGNISYTEVLRRAVATEKYLLEQQKNGDVIILENRRTGRQRELAFR